jgi:CheY-like chemotaxis protein
MPPNQAPILAAPTDDQASRPSNYAILVASDDQPLVAAITSCLRASGFAVCTPSPQYEGPDASEPAEPPSLIVLDTDMSPARRAVLLHTTRSSPRPPIVALAPRAKVRQTAATEGVWVCLAKPVELPTLLTAITRISRYAT